jgi:hypothetical protein
MENLTCAHPRVFKAILVIAICLFWSGQVFGKTTNWISTSSTDWFTAGNWDNGVPGSGDNACIGVNAAYTAQPALNSASATTSTINSLAFGPFFTQFLGVFTFNGINATLTVSANNTLIITNGIAVTPSVHLFGSYTAQITGSGSVTCASVQVGDLTTFPSGIVLFSNLLEFESTVSTFHVTGGVTVDSSCFGIVLGLLTNNSAFSLQSGTTTIDGSILTATASSGILNLGSATNAFSVDIPTGSALNPILKLTNGSPISSASLTGSIDFYNNTGGTGTSTVYYSGTAQTVYTTNTTILNSSPQTYQNLVLSGAGTKTIDVTTGGTLTVGNSLNTSATSVDFSVYNPVVTIGGSWTNSGGITQGSGNITVGGSLTNLSGGTLNLGSGNLSIAANYTNQAGGVYSQSTGTTIFNGSGAQALVDNSTTGTTFKAVTFNGGGTATMSAGTNNVNFAVAPTGVLTMSNSSKLAAGSTTAAYLTLKSDTTGTATVAAITGGCNITGFVTVQRFVQGSATYNSVSQHWKARNYRLMSSPVNQGFDASGNFPYSLNYLAAGTIITDCTSTYGSTPGNPSLYLHNEKYTPNNTTFTSGNFIGVTNISAVAPAGTITTTDATNPSAKIYVGEGFMIYFRGDKVTHITGSPSKTSYPYVAPESVTFSATGFLNEGIDSVRSWTNINGLMYTTSNSGNLPVRGFNLVGNPYPSSIDWSTFSNSNPNAPIYGLNVNPTVYLFNPFTGNYDTYNASSGISNGTATKIIPSGQGFFVQANAPSPKLAFNESAKITAQVTGSNLLLGTPAAQTAYSSYLRLKIIADSTNWDDIVIGFNNKATTKFDYIGDSGFLPGNGALASVAGISSDNVKTSVKWLPYPKGNSEMVLKLYVAVAATGTYTLQRTDFKAIPQLYRVWLMDSYLKDSLDIRNNTIYKFNVSLNDTASFGGNRFTVVIREDPALNVHLLAFAAVKATAGAQITWKTESEQNYTNFTVERSINGGATYNIIGGFTSSALDTYSFLDKNPLHGADQYRLKIEDLNNVVSYSNSIILNYENGSPVISNISIYPNPTKGILNLSMAAVTGPQNTKSLPVYTLDTVDPIPPNNAVYVVEIMNATGAIVKKATTIQPGWQGDLSNLIPGTYVVRVVNNSDQSVVGKGSFIKL